MTEDVGAARIDRDSARSQPPARGDGGVDRIAGRGREHEVGHRLELAPILVARCPAVLLGGLLFAAVEGEDAAREMGERLQIADRLQVVAGQDGREAKLLWILGGPHPGDEIGDAFADVLELSSTAVDARYACLQQQAMLHELVAERSLLDCRRA